MYSARQRESWFLDAASIYCDAVSALPSDLSERPVTSRVLTAFRDYVPATPPRRASPS
jgi:hypothetical protein